MQTSQIAVQSNIWQNNEILRQKRQNNRKQNYMPFLFRSKRQFLQIKDRIPPVGSYEVASSFSNIKQLNQFQPILKQQLLKQNQMCIFKSKQQRFNTTNNEVPGPASYNYKLRETNYKQIQKIKYRNLFPFGKSNLNLQIREQLNGLKKAPSCPTIPDYKVRYGYQKDSQGNYRLIEKTEQQVLKQKQELKEYCSTLVGEKFCNKNIQPEGKQRVQIKNKQIMSNLGKFTSKTLKLVQSETQINAKRMIKPKIKLSHPVNYVKPDQQYLGPGFYNVSLDTLKKDYKKQAFQFFGSTQLRFLKAQEQNMVNPYQNIFKENKNISIKQNSTGKIIKKSFINNLYSTLIQKQQNPGPGYYQPQISNVKKFKGNVKFCYQLRFKQNIVLQQQIVIIEKQSQDQSNKKMKGGRLQKQKIQFPYKQFQSVREHQIYGIMNQQTNLSVSVKKTHLKKQKNKQSPVFLDKSQRFQLCQQKSYQVNIENTRLKSKNQQKNQFSLTKGSFISKLQKRDLCKKQNTPGPGAYSAQKLSKRSFNIRNQ